MLTTSLMLQQTPCAGNLGTPILMDTTKQGRLCRRERGKDEVRLEACTGGLMPYVLGLWYTALYMYNCKQRFGSIMQMNLICVHGSALVDSSRGRG